MTDNAFDRAIAAHDAALEATGLAIWVGSEPTFTDRFSESPEWLNEALGDDKRGRAAGLVRLVSETQPGGLVMRSLGRQYLGEALPRWSFGFYQRRDGMPLWAGPPDPLTGAGYSNVTDGGLQALWRGLSDGLEKSGWQACVFQTGHSNFSRRITIRVDGQRPLCEPATDHRLLRPSIHSQASPPEGLEDELANEGNLLVLTGIHKEDHDGQTRHYACLELPTFPSSHLFRRFLDVLAMVAREMELDHLVIYGFPPPLDDEVAWTTVTPDPAVLEINMAPYASVTGYLSHMRTLFDSAAQFGLAPCRFYYNGSMVDSGGSGHITLGGASAAQSPFLRNPRLLPRLVAYFNRHPSLSYFFATDTVGSSGQSPRPDEGLRDTFAELELALDTITRSGESDISIVWQTLAPFMADHSGNMHRSEINVEKLCNPYLPGRGHMGLVEFRAFRMFRSAEQCAAAAALLRTIVAMLNKTDDFVQLVEWGALLHDRFALPFYLRQDLETVLADLDNSGFGLGEAICKCLVDDGHRLLGRATIGQCEITVRRAIQFWPLVGDLASQEGGGARLIDASCTRLEVLLRPAGDSAVSLDDWQLVVNGLAVPMRPEQDERSQVRLTGLRYRSFVPYIGLHPKLPAQGPLQLVLLNRAKSQAFQLILHDWRPGDSPYDGLPKDEEDARQRRAERFVVKPLDIGYMTAAKPAPAEALTPYSIDLRRVNCW
jgi:uncharacterized protein (DUF2126 family)